VDIKTGIIADKMTAFSNQIQ